MDEVAGPQCVTKQRLAMWRSSGTICTEILCVFRESEAARNDTDYSLFHSHIEGRKAILLDPHSSILPHLDSRAQHPPIRLANPSFASSPLVPISSISSIFFFPQKSFTPLMSRLLIISTSSSSTAAKQILKYAQLRLSLIPSVGAKMEPGATSTRYFSEVKWTHNPCASLAGEVLFQRGWEGKLMWTLDLC